MFLYNIRIAAKSLRRNPILTTLLIGAIALGICVSTTFVAMRHMLGKDPLPGKSEQVFYIRLDSWDPARAYVPDDPKSLPPQVTWRDMQALMRSKIPTRQTASFKSNFFVYPDPKVGRPYNETVRFVFGDFFPMFRLPFQYGSGWDKAADAKPEQVIVIDAATNEKLFGGVNSVGKTVRLGERTYRVVGVLDTWRPSVKFYDLTQDVISPPEAMFIPMNLTPALEPSSAGNIDGWKNSGADGYAAFLQSEVSWIQYWVELPTQHQQQAFKDHLVAYAREQKKYGRFQRPLHVEMTNLPKLMDEFRVVPPQVRAMSIVSLLFLAVCSLNLVGLLLGKFLARIPEVSVRRALGASKFQVFLQHIVECELVGVVGGTLGLALSFGMLKAIGKVIPNGSIFTLDLEMIGVSVFLSLIAGLLAGIYPAWRVCTVPPAMQLKVQ
jgi:putative ABC transport system permease protein